MDNDEHDNTDDSDGKQAADEPISLPFQVVETQAAGRSMLEERRTLVVVDEHFVIDSIHLDHLILVDVQIAQISDSLIRQIDFRIREMVAIKFVDSLSETQIEWTTKFRIEP